MGMSEREYHIKVLENLLSHYKVREQCEGYYDSTLKDNVEALEYAISSIKTDEAYQIMYEGGEIFTKDDIMAVLKNMADEINKRIQAIPYSADSSDIGVKVGYMYSLSLINANINALKENKDGTNS